MALTLDTRKGQVALLAAGPDSGSTVRLWHGDDSIELRSDEDGSRLTAVEDGEVHFQQPRAQVGAEACAAYLGALPEHSVAEVTEACRGRYTTEACAACLEEAGADRTPGE